jgi:hypothetical protein
MIASMKGFDDIVALLKKPVERDLIADVVTQCQGPDCLKEGTQRCNRCKAAYYCSRECQKRHWKTHKPVCKECS